MEGWSGATWEGLKRGTREGLLSGKEVRGEREVRGGGAWGEKRNKVGWGGEGVTHVYTQ